MGGQNGCEVFGWLSVCLSKKVAGWAAATGGVCVPPNPANLGALKEGDPTRKM